MNSMNKTAFLKFFGSSLLVGAMALTTGCSGGGDGGGETPPPTPSEMTSSSFGPSQTAENVTFSAGTLDGVLADDLPVTSMASVSLSNKSITISDGKGVRSFEITLRFDSTDFSNFSFTADDFIISSPSASSGTLATIQWSGSATPGILSVILTDAAGGNIPVMIK